MPSYPGKHVLTPDQLALSEARKNRKAKALLKNIQKDSLIAKRQWKISESTSPILTSEQTTIMTWNMLAQCLVRRELFPTSDCLKAFEREGMLYEEITSSDADIICLQEADRLEKLVPALEAANYAHIYTCGPRKLHGCVVAYKKDIYSVIDHSTVYYDDENIHEDATGRTETFRKGSSFKTRNVALIIGLKRLDSPETNVLVATTHLFWHPKYTYERTRQLLILLKSARKFAERNELQSCLQILAGDFNFTPYDPAYSLLVGNEILPQQEAMINTSRVVHVSLDPSVPVLDPKKAPEEDEGGEAAEASAASSEEGEKDPDRVITNARPATDADGLLTPLELERKFKSELARSNFKSVWDEWPPEDPSSTFSAKGTIDANRKGCNEPLYTSYTHYWKNTIDYVFVKLPNDRTLKVLGLLELPLKDVLEPGLPRKGVCGSDHLSIRARIAWPPSQNSQPVSN